MATPVKVGARNDTYALTEARRHHSAASQLAERAIRELGQMREVSGRPDYTRISETLGQLAIALAKVGRHHDEMYVIRAQAGVMAPDGLEQRIASLEAQLAEMQQLLQQTWFMPQERTS